MISTKLRSNASTVQGQRLLTQHNASLSCLCVETVNLSISGNLRALKSWQRQFLPEPGRHNAICRRPGRERRGLRWRRRRSRRKPSVSRKKQVMLQVGVRSIFLIPMGNPLLPMRYPQFLTTSAYPCKSPWNFKKGEARF